LKLEALEKWLSAQNASCRDAATPFSAEGAPGCGNAASNMLFKA